MDDRRIVSWKGTGRRGRGLIEALTRLEGLRKYKKIQGFQYPGTDWNQAPTALLLRQFAQYMHSVNKLIMAQLVKKLNIYRNPKVY
jgi:hypothetical protein